jgi:hypothetical protein
MQAHQSSAGCAIAVALRVRASSEDLVGEAHQEQTDRGGQQIDQSVKTTSWREEPSNA